MSYHPWLGAELLGIRFVAQLKSPCRVLIDQGEQICQLTLTERTALAPLSQFADQKLLVSFDVAFSEKNALKELNRLHGPD